MSWGDDSSGEIRGSVDASGYKGWIAVDSLQYGDYGASRFKESRSVSLGISDVNAVRFFFRMADGHGPPTPTVTIVVLDPNSGTETLRLRLGDVSVAGAATNGKSVKVKLNHRSIHWRGSVDLGMTPGNPPSSVLSR